VKHLWSQPEREYCYLALDVAAIHLKKKMNYSHLPTIEYCLTNKSWWDTVDYAIDVLGIIMINNKQELPSLTKRYLESGNVWLMRAAVLVQKSFKKQTDDKLLFDCVEKA
jgi:3-methyladenine DNA glycosylase AlkD